MSSDNTRPLERSRRTRSIAPRGDASLNGLPYRLALLRCGLVAGLILLVLGQLGFIGGDPSRLSLLLWFSGLAALVAVEWRSETPQAPASRVATERTTAISDARWRYALLVPVVLASAYILVESPSRKIDDPSLDIVVLWVFSIAALVVASGAWLDTRPSFAPRSTDAIDRT